jgi:hypothetical protein
MASRQSTTRRSGNNSAKQKPSEVQLFTRIPSDLRDWLKDEVGKIGDLTEKEAISNILAYLKSANNPELVRQVLVGGAAPGLRVVETQFSKAMRGMGQGDHAFARKFYSWAYEEYTMMSQSVDNNDYDLWTFIHFKSAYCLLEISYGIRHEILDKLKARDPKVDNLWGDYYDAADHCVSMALWHYKEIEALGEEHPVCYYNKACAWSLKCQNKVEREVGPDMRDMSAVAQVHRSEDANDAGEKPWKVLAQSWRKSMAGTAGAAVVEQVGRFAANCMSEFHNLTLYDKNTSMGFKPLYDTVFLYELASTDTDLDFIRYDPSTSDKFGAFLGGYDGSRLTSFNKIKERLPSHLQLREELNNLIG